MRQHTHIAGKARMGQSNPVQNGTHLHGHKLAVNLAMPNGLPRLPIRNHFMAMPMAEIQHCHSPFHMHTQLNGLRTDAHNPIRIKAHRMGCCHLIGNATLARIQFMVNGRSYRCKHMRDLALRRDRLETVRKLLGDKAS